MVQSFSNQMRRGNWLFLEGARTTVAPALARYLAGQAALDDGYWPSPMESIRYDFQSNKESPDNDGARAPRFSEPVWICEVAARPGAVDVARRAADQASSGAAVAEAKANRLVQISLSVLALAFVVGRLQLGLVVDQPLLLLCTLAPVLLAVGFLSMSAFQALQIDRVGFYNYPKAESLAALGARDPVAKILAEEEKGRQWAKWTSEKKQTALMQARAWFTRGLVVLILAAVVMLVSWWFLHDVPTAT